MAIPSTPTYTSTISAAMISAGQLNVSSTQVLNMLARGGQDIKTELWEASRADLLLATTTIVLVTTGSSVFTVPPDYDHEYTLTVFDGSVRDRAAGGTSASITLSANDTASDGAYAGRTVFTLAGTGSGQSAQITNYISATKVASVTQTWNTPDTTTDYLIAQWDRALVRTGDTPPQMVARMPYWYQITGPNLWVWPAPDKIYPIVMQYAPNLTMIDEVSSIFVQWLKQRMALVKQGIKVQTMALYDDDRYEAELQRWEAMKMRYGAQNPTYGHAERHR